MNAPAPEPGHPLITVAGLAAALGTVPPPAVLDVRWRLGGPPGLGSYLAGHIPGAVFADLDRDLAGAPGGPGGRHPLPGAGAFQAAMRRAGGSPGRPGGGRESARAGRWWSTTTRTRWRPPGPGGRCATSGTRTCGCWTAVTGPGFPRASRSA